MLNEIFKKILSVFKKPVAAIAEPEISNDADYITWLNNQCNADCNCHN